MNNNNIFNRKTEEDFNIKEFLLICISKWQWFVVSVLICLSFAAYKLATTHPTFTRYTEILIKTNDQDLGSQMEKFASLGSFRNNTTVFNEIHALQSPVNIYEVVRRLNLDMNYECDGRFHKNVLYGSNLPIKAEIHGIPENGYASFTTTIHPDGSYTLKEFVCSYGDTEEEIDPSIEARGKLSVVTDTINTPIGKISITPTAFYAPVEEDLTIYVSRIGLYSTAGIYNAKLSFSLKDKEADIIIISINDYSTQRASDILNAVVSVYNERWIDDKNQLAEHTSLFIESRLKSIAGELETVDSVISNYKSRHLLPDVKTATTMYMSRGQEIKREIVNLNNELSISRYILEYLNDNTSQSQIIPALQIGNNSIMTQITEYNRNMLQRNSLIASSSPENPLVKDIDNSLIAMKIAIINSVKNQITALTTRIATLEKEEQQTAAHIAQNPAQSKFLASEGRNQTVKEQLYLFLLQKREETELSKAFTAYNTRIITPPAGSLAPTGPNSNRTYMLALALGLMIPTGLILLREFTDTKIRSRKDIQESTIPIIGEIPLAYEKKTRLPWKKEKEKLQIVVKNGNRNVINEAFRVLRTNIEFMFKNTNKQVIIATSFNPGSGKSFTTINLGASIALKGKKVLLIDGDMRHTSLTMFITNNTKTKKAGLSNYLAGLTDNIEELIVKVEGYDCLHVLPSGTIPPNPTELLESDRLESLLKEMRSKYDYILIDCPPIDIVADTSIIERNADHTVFIVRSGLLERNMIPEMRAIYEENRFKGMSLLINGLNNKEGRYSYRYSYRYGYGYGYTEDE